MSEINEIPVNFLNEIDKQKEENFLRNKNKQKHNFQNQKINIQKPGLGFKKIFILILFFYSIIITFLYIKEIQTDLPSRVEKLYLENQNTYKQIKSIKTTLNK